MKRVLCLSLALALFLSLPSCRSEREAEIESEILAVRAENEARAESLWEEEPPVSEGIPDGGAATGTDSETAEKAAPKTDWDGIVTTEYQAVGSKFYFHTKEKRLVNGNMESVYMISYYDLTTGEHGVVCPDPLCQHNDPSVCKYIDVGGSTDFTMADEHTLIFGYKANVNAKRKICAFDLTENTYNALFTPKQISSDQMGIENGILWLRDVYAKTSGKKTTYYETIVGVRIETGEIAYQEASPEGCQAFFCRGGLLFCDNVKSIAAVDLKTGDLKKLIDYDADDKVGAWYYDTYREELWFSVINQTKQTGRVYRYANDVCEEVGFPAKEIYYFQLTNSKIYYSPYEPTYLGPNQFLDTGTWDYTNGKIYVVDRDDPSGEARLLYDADGKYLVCLAWVHTYAVFGNQLFLEHADIRRSTDPETGIEYVMFSHADEMYKIRVDLTTGEEEEIRFE